jgi:hypothetical protein
MQLDHGQAVIRVSCGGWIELRDPTLALDDEGKGPGVWTLDARDVPGFIPPGTGRSAQSGKRVLHHFWSAGIRNLYARG